MKRCETRHCSERQLLTYLVGDESPAFAINVARHVEQCRKCRAVLQEYRELLNDVDHWTIEDGSENAWQEQKTRVMAAIKSGKVETHQSVRVSLATALARGWEYTLAHPLPALGCIAMAIAFVSGETISIFRMDSILPSTGTLIQLLKQVL